MDLVIIGGGIAGLMAAYVASQHRGVRTSILEPGRLGGEFLSGGLKYIHRTDSMASMLCDLGVVFTNYTVNGGVLLHGNVEPYPDVLRSLEPSRAKRIQEDHWRKTRRTEPDPVNSKKSMNDPEVVGTRRALRCDASSLIGRLVGRASVFRECVTAVHPGYVITSGGVSFPYDYLIVTIPLWAAKQIVFFKLPDALAMRLNIVVVEPAKVRTDAGDGDGIGALRDPYAKWDYVYTPYTPDNLVHRIYPYEYGYACEFNGLWPDGDPDVGRALTSELNFLWPDGWAVRNTVRNLNGHLLPMESAPEWPEHIQPLGRFAQWDSRATADVVLDNAYALAARWGWKRCYTID